MTLRWFGIGSVFLLSEAGSSLVVFSTKVFIGELPKPPAIAGREGRLVAVPEGSFLLAAIGVGLAILGTPVSWLNIVTTPGIFCCAPPTFADLSSAQAFLSLKIIRLKPPGWVGLMRISLGPTALKPAADLPVRLCTRSLRASLVVRMTASLLTAVIHQLKPVMLMSLPAALTLILEPRFLNCSVNFLATALASSGLPIEICSVAWVPAGARNTSLLVAAHSRLRRLANCAISSYPFVPLNSPCTIILGLTLPFRAIGAPNEYWTWTMTSERGRDSVA